MIEADGNKAIEKTARLLRAGKIIAIKGVSGFHLAVDALNEKAVQKLAAAEKTRTQAFCFDDGFY